MSKKSKDKGAQGERDGAKFLSRWFPGAERGVSQCRGGKEGQDIAGVNGFFCESKRYKTLTTENWLAKAESDLRMATRRDASNAGKVPIVLMRADRGEYIVALRAETFFEMDARLRNEGKV